MEKPQKSHPVLPILQVDDDMYTLQVYELQLQKEGITNLRSCRSGKETLEILSAHEVALIVLDLHMPEMSGEEVLAVVAPANIRKSR